MWLRQTSNQAAVSNSPTSGGISERPGGIGSFEALLFSCLEVSYAPKAASSAAIKGPSLGGLASNAGATP
jgi:hypothetical protein